MSDLVSEALKLGFVKACLISTEDIVFNAEFRKYCEDNVCGKYNANYSCPPCCGSFMDMKNKIKSYSKAVLLQTNWKILDYNDIKLINECKKQHNCWSLNLQKIIGDKSLMCGAGNCDLCEECMILKGLPCCFPELSFSCLSAYCVYVKKMCDNFGFDYYLGDGQISFFGMICFNEK